MSTVGSDGKEYACSAGDLCSIPVFERSPEGGNGYPLQYLPGKFHEQRSLAGSSPWDHKRVRHDLVTKQQQLYMCVCVCVCVYYIYMYEVSIM